MALFRKFFYRKPPDGLLEISERVYVFDCCFTTVLVENKNYKSYIDGIVDQLRAHLPDASFMVFNYHQGNNQSQITDILSEQDMTVIDYPRQYENCPVLTIEMINHCVRSGDSWLLLGQRNVLLMHCEQGGWPILAFILAALLIYRNIYTGEQKTLDIIYRQAPRELLQLMSPLNPLPSQLRYLQYVSSRNLSLEWPPPDRALMLDCVILRLIPNMDGHGGCRLVIRIYGHDPALEADGTTKVLFSTPKKSRIVRHFKQAESELVKIDIHCQVQGDVVLECISLDDDLENEQIMFRVMFSTAFIRSNILMLNRDEIDTLWDSKDKFPKDFRTEVLFSEMDSAGSDAAIDMPITEEKGLPEEAFATVQEIFSNFDWIDSETDVAQNVLQKLTTSTVLKENAEMVSSQGAEVDHFENSEVIVKDKLKSSKPSLDVNMMPRRKSVSGGLVPAIQKPSQSKIISPRILQSCRSSVGLYYSSFQASPRPPIQRFHSSPSSLGITALLHDHDDSREVSVSSVSELVSEYAGSPCVDPSKLDQKQPPPPPPSLKQSLSLASVISLSTSPSQPQPPPPPPCVLGNAGTVKPPSPPPSPPCVPGTVGTVKPPSPPPPHPSCDAGNVETIKPLSPPSPPLPHVPGNVGTVKPPSPPPPPPPPPRPPPNPGRSTSVPLPPPPPKAMSKDAGSMVCPKAPPVPPPPAPFGNGLPKANNGPGPPPPGPPCVKTRSPSRVSPRGTGQSKKSNLKPYHWLKLTRVMQGSLWAETQKSDEASKAPDFDMSELENLFAASVPNSENGGVSVKSARRVSGPKNDKVQLIDLRRAYNCEIMLSKVKVPLPELMNAVLALDDSALDIDQVENLIKFCPTKEEMEQLKGYKGDKENLGKCEQFFLELMKVPRVESKLRVFAFKMQFKSQLCDLRKSLQTVNSASEEIRTSAKLKRVMQTILSLGNALNQGTARGSAVGFRLDSLLKLTDTRARNNKMTLMHYLCKVLADRLPELLDFPKDLVSLEGSTKIQLKFLAEEMQAISKGLEKVVQELTTARNDGPTSEAFCKILKQFLAYAEGEVRSLAYMYSIVGRNADALAMYFGEDPAKCPFEQVVSTLLNFVRMFIRAHDENCKQLEAEKKKAEKEAENEKKLKTVTRLKDYDHHFPMEAK